MGNIQTILNHIIAISLLPSKKKRRKLWEFQHLFFGDTTQKYIWVVGKWDGKHLIMLNPRIPPSQNWPPKELEFSKSTSSIITSPIENRHFYWDIHQFLDKATTEISNKIRIKRRASWQKRRTSHDRCECLEQEPKRLAQFTTTYLAVEPERISLGIIIRHYQTS